MSTTQSVSPAAGREIGDGTTLTAGLSAWVRAKVKRWRERYEHRAALAALRALDDRMLKDIGLHRSQLASLTFRPHDDSVRPRR